MKPQILTISRGRNWWTVSESRPDPFGMFRPFRRQRMYSLTSVLTEIYIWDGPIKLRKAQTRDR